MTIRQAARIGLVMISLTVVLALYYWAHKPLSPAQAIALVQSLFNLAVSGLLVLTAGGLGRWLLRRGLGQLVDGLNTGEFAGLAAALGFGALGQGVLLVGALRGFYPVVAWLLLGALFAVFRGDIGLWLSDLRRFCATLAPDGRLDRLGAISFGLVLVVGLLAALAPPTTWDSLVYHLTLPELYLRAHSVWIEPSAVSLSSGFPQLNEMLFTAAKLLRLDFVNGNITAQVVGWAIGLLLGLSLAAHARALALPGWLAASLLFSSLTLAQSLAWAYSELLMLFMALAALIALRQWRAAAGQRFGVRWLVLAGVFGGLACACKYPGLLVPLASGAVVLALELSGGPANFRSRLVRAFTSGGLLAAAAALTFAPWMVKNLILTGNPVYPLLWPAADMDALRQWYYSRPDLAEPLWRAVTLFIRASLFGVQSGNVFDTTLGPLLLLGLVLLPLGWRGLAVPVRRDLWPSLCFALAAYGVWVGLALTSGMPQQARPYLSFLPAVALLGAAAMAGLRQLDTAQFKLSTVTAAGYTLVLSLTWIELASGFIAHNPLPYLAGQQTAADYQAAELGWLVPALARLNELPPGSDVLFLWEPRTLGCDQAITCRPDAIIDRWWHLRRLGLGAEQVLAQWRSAGVTHVLVFDTGLQFIRTEEAELYQPTDWGELARLRGQLRPVWTMGDTYTLYAMP